MALAVPAPCPAKLLPHSVSPALEVGGPPSLPFLGAPPSLPSLGSPSGCACGLTANPAGTEPALARGRSTVPERWWRLGGLGPSGSDLRTRAPPRPEQAATWGRSAWRWVSRKTSGTPPNRERAERPQCHKTPLGLMLDGRQVVNLSEWPWRSRLCPLHRVKPAPQGHHPGGPLRAPASHPKLGAQDSMGARLGLSLQRDHAAP